MICLKIAGIGGKKAIIVAARRMDPVVYDLDTGGRAPHADFQHSKQLVLLHFDLRTFHLLLRRQ